MPEDKFDYAAARKAGYSDDEIQSYLQSNYDFKFDITGARNSGYSDAEINSFLSSQPLKKKIGGGVSVTEPNDFLNVKPPTGTIPNQQVLAATQRQPTITEQKIAAGYGQASAIGQQYKPSEPKIDVTKGLDYTYQPQIERPDLGIDIGQKPSDLKAIKTQEQKTAKEAALNSTYQYFENNKNLLKELSKTNKKLIAKDEEGKDIEDEYNFKELEKTSVFQNKLAEITKGLESGNTAVTYYTKGKNAGKPVLTRAAGFWESTGNSIVNSFVATKDALSTMGRSDEYVADYYDEQRRNMPEIPESTPVGAGSMVGGVFGGVIKPAAEFYVGEQIEPLGGGLVTTAMDIIPTTTSEKTKEIYYDRMAALENKYGKDNVPQAERMDAIRKAREQAPLLAIPEEAMQIYLFGKGMGGAAHTEALQTFNKVLTKAGGDIAQMSLLGGASELATQGIKQLQTGEGKFDENISAAAGNWALMEGVFKALPVTSKALGAAYSKVVSSAAKNVMATADPIVVQKLSEEAVQQGWLTPDQANDAVKDVADFAAIRKTLPDNLPEDKAALIAGLIQKNKALEEEKKAKDKIFHDDIDAEIKANEQKAKDILNSNAPLKHETDNLTGQRGQDVGGRPIKESVDYWLNAADKEFDNDADKINFLQSILKGEGGGEKAEAELHKEEKPALQKAIDILKQQSNEPTTTISKTEGEKEAEVIDQEGTVGSAAVNEPEGIPAAEGGKKQEDVAESIQSQQEEVKQLGKEGKLGSMADKIWQQDPEAINRAYEDAAEVYSKNDTEENGKLFDEAAGNRRAYKQSLRAAYSAGNLSEGKVKELEQKGIKLDIGDLKDVGGKEVYHLSVSSGDVEKEGFLTQDEILKKGGKRGVGGGRGGISLTYDRNYAERLYRIFNEIKNALNGKVDIADEFKKLNPKAQNDIIQAMKTAIGGEAKDIREAIENNKTTYSRKDFDTYKGIVMKEIEPEKFIKHYYNALSLFSDLGDREWIALHTGIEKLKDADIGIFKGRTKQNAKGEILPAEREYHVFSGEAVEGLERITPKEITEKEITLQNERQRAGNIKAKVNSEKVQYNGTDAIGSRSRTKSETANARASAKEKIKNPETNASLKAANAYTESVGLPKVQPHEFKPSEPKLQGEIAKEYPKLQDVNSSTYKETELERGIYKAYKEKYPELIKQYDIKDYKDLVNKSYGELIKEVDKQFNALPVKIDFHEGDRNYENSAEMLDDVHNFNHLWVYKGGDDHTALGSKTRDENGLTANDKFRAVHDYFGHSIEGYQFGKDGEENAWIEHSKMFSPLAQWALSSETRGQNSFVNYSGANEVPLQKIKTGSALKSKGIKEDNQELINEGQKLIDEANSEFYYAEQKAIILKPEHTDFSNYYKPKTEKNAIQERSAKEISVDEASRGSEKVGARVPESGEAALSQKESIGKSKEKIADFDKRVDDYVDKILSSPTAKKFGLKVELPEGTQKSGAGSFEDLLKGAANIIKKAYHAKEGISLAIEAAIDYIKENWNKAWGKFEDVFDKEDFVNRINFINSIAPQVTQKGIKEAVETGGVKGEKIVQTQRQALKKQIQDFARGFKQGVEEGILGGEMSQGKKMAAEMRKLQEQHEIEKQKIAAGSAKEKADLEQRHQKEIEKLKKQFDKREQKATDFGYAYGKAEEQYQQKIFAKYIGDFVKVAFNNKSINKSQAKALIRRAAKVGSSEARLNNFIDYANNVIEHSDYVDSINDVKGMQKTARKIYSPFKSAVKAFTDINPEKIPPEILMKYKQALDEMTGKAPKYNLMQDMFYEIETLKVKQPKKFQEAKTIKDVSELWDKVQNQKMRGVFDYQNKLSDINRLKTKLDELLENDAIEKADYDALMKDITDAQEGVEAGFAQEIESESKNLVNEIKDKAIFPDENATVEERELLQKVHNLTRDDLKNLSFEELYTLNELIDNVNDGFVDVLRIKRIVDNAEGMRSGELIATNTNKLEPVKKSSDVLVKKLAKQESVFWEGLLGYPRRFAGALQKYVVSPFVKAIANYSNDIKNGYGKFVQLKKKYNISEEQMNKIGMVVHYLQEYSAQFNPRFKGIKDIGTRDRFAHALTDAVERNNYSTERKSKFFIKHGLSEVELMDKIYAGLPKDSNGKVNPKDVYDSFTNKDGRYLTSNEQKFLDEIQNWESENITDKQRFANEIRGQEFEQIPFHMIRQYKQRGEMPTASGELNPNTNNITIKSGSGEERTVPAESQLRAVETNYEKLFIKKLETTSRDYHLTDMLQSINKVLGTALEKTNPANKNRIIAMQQNIADALTYEFGKAKSSEAITRTLLNARAAEVLLRPERTFLQELPASISYAMRARTAEGYKHLFDAPPAFKELLDYTKSPLRLRENINKAFDVDNATIKQATKLEKATLWLSGLPERTMMKTVWMPTFEDAFRDATGVKFDANKFKTDASYRSQYNREITEAGSSADAQIEKIIGTTAKAAGRREIEIAPNATVRKDTGVGSILGFFGNYPYREFTEFVNGFREMGERVREGEGVKSITSLSKPLGVIVNLMIYGYMSSLVYSWRSMFFGTDKEKEKGKEMWDTLNTKKGLLHELESNLAQTAASKYGQLGRTGVQLLVTAAYSITKDKEQKKLIREWLKGATYMDVAPITDEFKGDPHLAAAKTVSDNIASLSLIVNRLVDAMGGVDEAQDLMKRYSEGKLTGDKKDLAQALDVIMKGSQIFLNTQGTSIPMYQDFQQLLRGWGAEVEKPKEAKKPSHKHQGSTNRTDF